MGRPAAASVTVDTATRLLDAATLEFGAQGFAQARLADIAARAGIRRPSLLHHFPTKTALYEATVRRTFARLAERLFAVMADTEDVERAMEGLVESFVAHLREEPAVAGLIVRELIAEKGEARLALLQEIVRLVGAVEAFLREHGEGVLRPGLPLRPALMKVCSGVLMHAAIHDLREPLWGPGEHAVTLARTLFFQTERGSS